MRRLMDERVGRHNSKKVAGAKKASGASPIGGNAAAIKPEAMATKPQPGRTPIAELPLGRGSNPSQ